MGWSADGSTLYCVYSVTMPDTSRGYNQRDIFCSYSLDNAATWSNPIRITNTTDIDETYPSVSFWNPGTPGNPYELHITYMKDPGVGPSSFGGSAPATRNTLIYRKMAALPPIGIINNQNLLKEYRLTQNYPNPFNPSTKIEYNIIKSGLVTLKVYDVLGREVRTLVNEVQSSGVKEIEFNAAALPSGIYFYTLSAGDFTNTKKMILIK
ncbi:MAG: T9SS type A sorting domain-containing protein [Ignavibacteria bacterium]|nr:T9SS type A sorting domain-containing protein [Ignavibacteria bacterium]